MTRMAVAYFECGKGLRIYKSILAHLTRHEKKKHVNFLWGNKIYKIELKMPNKSQILSRDGYRPITNVTT